MSISKLPFAPHQISGNRNQVRADTHAFLIQSSLWFLFSNDWFQTGAAINLNASQISVVKISVAREKFDNITLQQPAAGVYRAKQYHFAKLPLPVLLLLSSAGIIVRCSNISNSLP